MHVHAAYLCMAVSVKNLSLRLLLIILTAMDNVSQNAMLEYVMMNSIFEAIMQVCTLTCKRCMWNACGMHVDENSNL